MATKVDEPGRCRADEASRRSAKFPEGDEEGGSGLLAGSRTRDQAHGHGALRGCPEAGCHGAAWRRQRGTSAISLRLLVERRAEGESMRFNAPISRSKPAALAALRMPAARQLTRPAR